MKPLGVFLLFVVALTALPATSFAVSGEKAKVFLAFFVGPQFYAMSDVNRGIDEDNEVLAGSGFTAKRLEGGTGFGAGVRVWTSQDRICLLFDYNRLTAKASSSGFAGTVPVDESVAAPANALTATLGYFRKWRGTRYGIGGGAGYYICNGRVDARAGAEHLSYELEGNGLGFHALAMTDIAISKGLHFEAALGYRSAKSGDLKSNGSPVTLNDGSAVRADWSGVSTRIGFSIPFDPGPYPTPAGAE